MMFIFHISYALMLIALSLGVSLIVWSFRNEGRGICLAKTVGHIIAILALLSILCETYYAVKYWSEGYYQTPTGMQMMQNQGETSGMPNMMKGGMMQSQGMKSGTSNMNSGGMMQGQ